MVSSLTTLSNFKLKGILMKNEKIKVHFLGGVGTVTGSKYLIEALGKKIMVDCGLFQGLKKLRLLNWDTLPTNVSEIDVVLLTHGHLDHTGYLPKLVKSGYKKSIWGTAPTIEIAEIILKDSAKINEEEAEQANKKGYSKHSPAKPLYNLKNAEKTIQHLKKIESGKWLPLFEGIKVRFQYNGHIIGSTFIELDVLGKLMVFSGDVGREHDMLLSPPKRPKKADILFIESTYGDRLHPTEKLEEKMQDIVYNTWQDGGTLIIPSFAVERTQTLMYLFWQLRLKGRMPNIPIYMDSPMGANVLDVFRHNPTWHKLTNEECDDMCKYIQVVESYRETWEIIDNKKSKIIIAGSGMISGGRVLTYLTKYVEDPKTRVLLVGFQAEGTRGRQLLEGIHEVKIYGKYYPVKAQILNDQSLSAHADQKELLNWLSSIQNFPEKVFITHGEPQASDVMRVKLKDTFGWKCIIPELYSTAEIELSEDALAKFEATHVAEQND
jgi:metallo-beta-lactamase family protein